MRYEFPIGFKYQGKDIKYFDINKRLTGQTLKVIYDTNTLSRGTFKWMARVVSLLLTEVKGDGFSISPYEEFKKNGFSGIPDIVNYISPYDAPYVLLCGHIANYRTYQNEQIETNCSFCKSSIRISVNFEDIKINFLEKVQNEIVVKLQDGYITDFPPEVNGINWNQIKFRMPTLRDSIECENEYSIRGGEYEIAITKRCVNNLYSMNENEEHAISMPDNARSIKLSTLFDDLTGEDLRLIGKGFSELPICNLEVNTICPKCGYEIGVGIAGNFFPKR